MLRSTSFTFVYAFTSWRVVYFWLCIIWFVVIKSNNNQIFCTFLNCIDSLWPTGGTANWMCKEGFVLMSSQSYCVWSKTANSTRPSGSCFLRWHCNRPAVWAGYCHDGFPTHKYKQFNNECFHSPTASRNIKNGEELYCKVAELFIIQQ